MFYIKFILINCPFTCISVTNRFMRAIAVHSMSIFLYLLIDIRNIWIVCRNEIKCCTCRGDLIVMYEYKAARVGMNSRSVRSLWSLHLSRTHRSLMSFWWFARVSPRGHFPRESAALNSTERTFVTNTNLMPDLPRIYFNRNIKTLIMNHIKSNNVNYLQIDVPDGHEEQ